MESVFNKINKDKFIFYFKNFVETFTEVSKNKEIKKYTDSAIISNKLIINLEKFLISFNKFKNNKKVDGLAVDKKLQKIFAMEFKILKKWENYTKSEKQELYDDLCEKYIHFIDIFFNSNFFKDKGFFL